MKHKYVIEISNEDREALEKIAKQLQLDGVIVVTSRPKFVPRMLEYTAKLLAEGVRRPSSWEAAAVAAMFGS